MSRNPDLIEEFQDSIAVIAMAGRFPGADNLEQFWSNLENEVESVTFFSQEQLLASGVDPELLENPNMVGAEGVLKNVEYFDAEFFGFSPREAELLDPQHRIYLETIWELLERAGYSSEKTKEVIGVYSGAGASSYLARNLLTHRKFVRDVGTFKVSLSTGQDFVTTRASYKLGLTGPSVNVNTLCSSSSVAVHYAREALLAYQCDIAVAGGVTISNSREDALFYQEGGIGSFDGHCRAFDARAAGTVAGNGIAMVALKRMEDALQDGDQIIGVIRGTAINNDGADKASYTAPSPEGQARCIAEAIEIADINPETISYVEAHGTGTNLGDPIEISGLTRAFRRFTDKTNFCGVGSVKTNIGHLVSAGGVASMIKTLMAMQHRTLPASLNFESPNPKIDFAKSPFYVVDKTKEWQPSVGDVLRAGVSSFGIGGTNSHIVLEEAPALEQSDDSTGIESVFLSAKTSTALTQMKSNLAAFVEANKSLKLADLAFTLKVGRHNFEHRFCASVANLDELLECLTKPNGAARQSTQKSLMRDICFAFPGQGSQYANMGRFLYSSQDVYKAIIDEASDFLTDTLGQDLRTLLFPVDSQLEAAQEKLKDTVFAQLSLFVTEYAMAQTWISWGLKPQRMIGHSIGEYVAACIAGVFTFTDGLKIVTKRSSLMASMPAGTMLSVAAPKQKLEAFLNDDIWLSVQNSEAVNVLSGSNESVERLKQALAAESIEFTELHTSHAFHSGLMESALAPFKEFLDGLELKKATIPFISNVSANWVSGEEATANYWVEHLRSTVRFSDSITQMYNEDKDQFIIEVGPGTTLSSLIKQNIATINTLCSAMPHPRSADNLSQERQIAQAFESLWLSGIDLDWKRFYAKEFRRRVALPTYPFERQRYWIDAVNRNDQTSYETNHVVGTELALAGSGDFVSSISVELRKDTDSALSSDLQKKLHALHNQYCSDLNSLLDGQFTVTESKIKLQEELAPKSDAEIQEETSNSGSSTSHGRPSGAVTYVKPENDTQLLLASHWEEVLGYAPVGINDNFFDMGGHSLIAAALVTKTRKQFDVEIPLREVLEAPTIKQLSDLIENYQWLNSSKNQPKSEEVEVLEL